MIGVLAYWSAAAVGAVTIGWVLLVHTGPVPAAASLVFMATLAWSGYHQGRQSRGHR